MDATSEPTPNTLEALLASHGPAIGGFAYLVLQHQADAERILAATLATALGRAGIPSRAEDMRTWLLRIAAREILRGSPQTGEVAPLLPDPRSVTDRMSILGALAELDPRSRMAVVLHYYLDLGPDAVASILDDDPFALRSDLNEARNRLQSRIEELQATEGTYHPGVPAQPSPLEPFDARLTRALVEESGRFVPVLHPQELRDTRPAERVRLDRRWWPLALLAFAALLLAGVAGFFWLVPEPGPTTARHAASSQNASSSLTADALSRCMPMSAFSRSTECHNQDKVSMGTIAARDARTIVEIAENIAAIHLIVVCQALELRGVERMSPRTRAVYDRVRDHVTFLEGDRRMDKDIEVAAELVRSGELTRAAGLA